MRLKNEIIPCDEYHQSHSHSPLHILFEFFKIIYKLYISISFIGVTQQFSDVCFHCGQSNALDAEACKRKLKDYGIVRPICGPCIASGKEIC